MHLQQLVNDLACDLGVSLLVEDREHRVVAFSPQFNDIDEVRRDTILTRNARAEVQSWLHDLGIHKARTPMRVPPNESLNMLPRVCVPVWNATSPLGYLWVIDSAAQQDPTQLGEVARAGDRIAAAWQLDRLTAPLTARDRSDLVQHIWAGSPAEAGNALARWRAELGLDGAAECRPVLLRLGSPDGAASARDRRLPAAAVRAAFSSAFFSRAMWSVTGREARFVLPASEAALELLVPALEQASAALKQQHGVTGAVRVGIGPATAEALELQRAIDQAQTSIGIGDAFDLPDPVIQWDSLGVYRAAYELSVAGMQPQHLSPGFTDLLAVDGDGVLLSTLERYLATGCSARDTAAALRIHRTSLYYRLDRAAGALSCDLSEGTHRLGLHLALLVHRLAGHTPAPPVR